MVGQVFVTIEFYITLLTLGYRRDVQTVRGAPESARLRRREEVRRGSGRVASTPRGAVDVSVTLLHRQIFFCQHDKLFEASFGAL